MKLKKPSQNQLAIEAADEVHLALLSVAKCNAKTPDQLLRHAITRLCRALGKLSPEQLRAFNQEAEKHDWRQEMNDE